MTMKLTAAVVAAAMLAGCAQQDVSRTARENRVAVGTVAGAALGAAAGLLVGGDDRRNALVGAGIGALAGAGVGVYLDRQEAQLNQDLAGTGATVVNTGQELLVTLPQDVTFATGSATVAPQFMPTLTQFAQTLQKYPESYVDVIGHTDSQGGSDFNQGLSERRAQSVASILTARGVTPARVVAYGFGETKPIASNDTATGRAANRRVEVKITPFTQS